MSQYDHLTALNEGYDPEEKRQRYPLGTVSTKPEHALIRHARTWHLSGSISLQRAIDSYFIGAMQEIGRHTKHYGMDAVAELVAAYDKASEIAGERMAKAAQEENN